MRRRKKKTNPQILSNFLDSFLSEPNCIVQWWKHSTKHLPSSHSQHCFVIENNAASKQPKALISVLYSQYHVDLLPLVVCARATVNVWGHEWWAGGAARGRYVWCPTYCCLWANASELPGTWTTECNCKRLKKQMWYCLFLLCNWIIRSLLCNFYVVFQLPYCPWHGG